jgi:hypothetical protein
MFARFTILSGEPMRGPSNAVRMQASGETGLAATSLKKLAACALIAGSSPRT